MSKSTKVMSHDPLADAAPAGIVELDESLTIADLGGLQPQLVGLVDAGAAVTLNGEQVETIDGAGLQLLAAFCNECAAKNVEVTWQGATEVLRRGAETLGLSGVLRLDAAA